MSDHYKKPKNVAMKQRPIEADEFDRICREEAADGETVVVARAICSAPFPCLMDIYVLAGFNPSCECCAKQVQPMRDLMGWKRCGELWTSANLTEEQQDAIAELARQKAMPF